MERVKLRTLDQVREEEETIGRRKRVIVNIELLTDRIDF